MSDQDLGKKGPSHLQGARSRRTFGIEAFSAGACGEGEGGEGCATGESRRHGCVEVLYRRHQEKHDGGRRTQKRGSETCEILLGPLPCAEGGQKRGGEDLGIVSSGIHSRGVSGVASGMAGASAGDTFSDGECRWVDGTSARSVLPVGGRVHSGERRGTLRISQKPRIIQWRGEVAPRDSGTAGTGSGV